MIEDRLKEIEEFNGRNFKVDNSLLQRMQPLFEEMDFEIVSAPFVEYTEANPPSYLPDASKWINIIVQSQVTEDLRGAIKPLQRSQTVVNKKGR